MLLPKSKQSRQKKQKKEIRNRIKRKREKNYQLKFSLEKERKQSLIT